jgi:hypothetical protein
MNRSLRGALALVVRPAAACDGACHDLHRHRSGLALGRGDQGRASRCDPGLGFVAGVQLPPNIVHAAPGVTIQPVPGQTWSIASLGVNGAGYTIKGIDFAMAPNIYGLDVPGQDIVFDGVKVHQADNAQP